MDNPGQKRNHYIPRMLLNRFASRTEGKKHWIWQTGQDGQSREISTRDAAVGSLFYGESSTGVERALSEVESRIATVLRRLDEAGESLSEFAPEIRRFV